MNQFPYGTSGICPNTEHWILEANAAMAEYNNNSLPPYPEPDGISANISVSPTKSVPIGITFIGAYEAVYNFHSKDMTFFGITGFGAKVGAGATAEVISFADIYNIGDDNLNYGGNFQTIDVSGAYVCGLSLGYSQVPQGRRFDPRSFSIGGVVGIGGQVQVSQTEYIPLFTVHQNGEITTHTNEYLHNPETKGYITNYYRKLYQSLKPYME